MLARLVRWLIRAFPILSYDYRRRRIKRRQFCPACANKVKVEMRFNPAQRQVVCQCPRCLACWGYDTAVKPDQFAALPKVEE